MTRFGERVQPVYDFIQNAVATSKTTVGGDETGTKDNGKKFWAWIWQTVTLTYIAASESRGKKVINLLFPGGFANTVLVSDRWRSHIRTYA